MKILRKGKENTCMPYYDRDKYISFEELYKLYPLSFPVCTLIESYALHRNLNEITWLAFPLSLQRHLSVESSFLLSFFIIKLRGWYCWWEWRRAWWCSRWSRWPRSPSRKPARSSCTLSNLTFISLQVLTILVGLGTLVEEVDGVVGELLNLLCEVLVLVLSSGLSLWWHYYYYYVVVVPS